MGFGFWVLGFSIPYPVSGIPTINDRQSQMILALTTVDGENVLVVLPNVLYIGEIKAFGPSKEPRCIITLKGHKEFLTVRQSFSEIRDALSGMLRDVGKDIEHDST